MHLLRMNVVPQVIPEGYEERLAVKAEQRLSEVI